MSSTERELFETRISEMKSKKGRNDVMINAVQYKDTLDAMKRMQDPEYIPTTNEKNLQKRFEILSIETDNGLIEKLVKPDKKGNGTRLRFVMQEDLYDTIKKVHEQLLHPGRHSTYKELKESFANITQEHTQIFCNCCKHCQIKVG